MFDNKVIDFLLNKIPQDKWNYFSKVLARFSIPYIGSPISFQIKSFTIKEYSISDMDTTLMENFLSFCYPLNASNRALEIDLDRQYWKNASTFLVFDSSKKIVGCLQFIFKTSTNKIPVEYAFVKNDLDIGNNPPQSHFKPSSGKYAEIYRCRRSFDLTGVQASIVIAALFKAAWIKTIQTSTEHICISYDAQNKGLKNLYCKKLFFQNPKIALLFGDDPKQWNLLIKDCLLHETNFANLSKEHFYLQTWFRKNSIDKNLKVPAIPPVSSPVLSEEDTILFASVAHSKRKRKTAPADKKSAKTV